VSNRDHILSLVKAISGNANMLSVPRLFVDLTGDLTLAAMLSQLIYWSDRAVRYDGFVFKSSTDWRIEIGASRYAVNKFNDLPYIETQIKMAKGHPTNHYKVRMDVLVDHLEQLFDVEVSEIDQDSMGAKLPQSLSETEQDSMGAKLPQPLSDIEQCTVPNEQNHCPKTDNPLSEIEQSITETTTKNTTQITTNIKEVQDFFSAKAETPNFKNKKFFANSKRRKKMKPKPTEKPQDTPEDLPDEQPPSEFPAFISTLAKITGLDISLRSNAGRLGRASSQLLHAGYSIRDLNGFLNWWMDTDWRWKKDKQMPTPENVLTHIAQYKNTNSIDDLNRRRYEQWLK